MRFVLADGVAVFVFLKWELGIVEAIIVIMAVGLSVDFVVHFGVGYIHANAADVSDERRKVRNRYASQTLESSLPSTIFHCQSTHGISSVSEINPSRLLCQEQQAEREKRVTESASRVGSAVFMAAFTTFAAGFSMTLSSLSSFQQMGQFLMTISTPIAPTNYHRHMRFSFSVDVVDLRELFLPASLRDHWTGWHVWLDPVLPAEDSASAVQTARRDLRRQHVGLFSRSNLVKLLPTNPATKFTHRPDADFSACQIHSHCFQASVVLFSLSPTLCVDGRGIERNSK